MMLVTGAKECDSGFDVDSAENALELLVILTDPLRLVSKHRYIQGLPPVLRILFVVDSWFGNAVAHNRQLLVHAFEAALEAPFVASTVLLVR
jgi:hypothetical protein